MIIAEIGQAHDGSLGMAHAYINALKDTGVQAIKFQMHIADAESSSAEPFRVPFSYEDATRFDYWKRMEFTPQQWFELKTHCEANGLEFICSPFSNAAVDVLEDLHVHRYKIGSGEVTNHLLLEKIAATKKPVILSSGMNNWNEIDAAIQLFQEKSIPISLLQCTTSYPSLPTQWGLNNISIMQNRYQIPVGYSDHSGDIYACMAAAALGATLFEFHIVFDQGMFGPDATSSIPIHKVKQLTTGIAAIQMALQHPIDKNDLSGMKALKSVFEKSLAVNQNLPAGTVIQFEHLEAKKPAGMGIAAGNYKEILGSTLLHAKEQWSFLNTEDLNPE